MYRGEIPHGMREQLKLDLLILRITYRFPKLSQVLTDAVHCVALGRIIDGNRLIIREENENPPYA